MIGSREEAFVCDGNVVRRFRRKCRVALLMHDSLLDLQFTLEPPSYKIALFQSEKYELATIV
jgi:hypothetical protein